MVRSRCHSVTRPPLELSPRTPYPRVLCPPGHATLEYNVPLGPLTLELSVLFRVRCPLQQIQQECIIKIQNQRAARAACTGMSIISA